MDQNHAIQHAQNAMVWTVRGKSQHPCPDLALSPSADVASGARCGWVLHQLWCSHSCCDASPGMGVQRRWGQRQSPLLWCGMRLWYSGSLGFAFVTVT